MRMLRRLAAASAVSVIVLMSSAPAAATTPPPVDHTLLPRPGPVSPRQPTEQHDECYASTGDAAPGKQSNTALQTIRPLTRGAGQTVAVIDTGVARHRLLPRLVAGGDYVSTGDGTQDCDGHGTIVAGIIAAAADSQDAGFGGVAPDATIIAIRQSSNRFRPAAEPSASGYGDVDTLAAAVRTAADMGATVINISSIACVAADDAFDDRALGAALSYAVDVKNVVVVTAAGNVGGPAQCPEQNPTRPGQPDWAGVRTVVTPGWYDDLVLTVGSVESDSGPSPFSLAGPWVDVAAPGTDVISLDPDGEGLIDTLSTADGSKPISGTSYAAPVVSGVAALIRARWPQLTARQVMARIEDTAQRPSGGWDPVVGHGVVDVVAAVTGGAPVLTSGDAGRQRVSPSGPVEADPGPRHMAFTGVAICGAVAILITVSASARRSRRSDGVTQH